MEGGSRAGRIACLMGVTGLADSAHVSYMSLSSCLGASSKRSGLHRSDVGVFVKVLELTKSPNLSAFRQGRQLCKEVYAVCAQEADHVVFLTPTKTFFGKLSTTDNVNSLADVFKPILKVCQQVESRTFGL